MPRLLALLSLFSLTGCWIGGPFYTASDARLVIPAGNYAMTRNALPGEMPEPASGRVEQNADGTTRILDFSGSSPRELMTVGFTPLAGGNRYVAWITRFDSQDMTRDGAAYAVLTPAENGSFRLAFPGCGSPMESVALQLGATSDYGEDGVKRCRFSDREGLEQALRNFADDVPEESLVVTLTPRG